MLPLTYLVVVACHSNQRENHVFFTFDPHLNHIWLGPDFWANRLQDWKLIRWYETGVVELYNLKDDLSESDNLASEQPEIIRKLSESLDKWLKDFSARRPAPNPKVHNCVL